MDIDIKILRDPNFPDHIIMEENDWFKILNILNKLTTINFVADTTLNGEVNDK